MRPTGIIMAPPTPCRTRQATSISMLVGEAAQHRAQGEKADRRGEDAPRAEAVGHPAAHRDEDGEAQRIARQHRLHAERRHVHRPGDGRHRGVEDRGVERLHEERHGDQPRQQPLDGIGRAAPVVAAIVSGDLPAPRADAQLAVRHYQGGGKAKTRTPNHASMQGAIVFRADFSCYGCAGQRRGMQRRSFVGGLIAASVALPRVAFVAQADPLPSWNEGPAKQAILDFVSRTTTAGGPDFVPVPERIATFDNDGTLWTEQPIYFQFDLRHRPREGAGAAASRMEGRASRSSRCWPTTCAALAASGEKGLLEIMAATHTGMTTEEFTQAVLDWIATARHPRFNRPYTELVYQPMLELLAYLRANQFKTFIVSGGGIEFMRPWTERVYGIPPEQVVGSSGVMKYRAARRQAGADEGAEGRVHRRRAGQAGRHQPLHRPAADLRLRQLRRRPADAGMDGGRRRRALHGPRPSHRRRARIRLRPRVARSAGSTRRGTRRCGASGRSST